DVTKDQVAENVARAYLASLREDAAYEAARANVDLSQALQRLSQSQKDAGTGTGIEVTRAQVQLANDNQRLAVAENNRRRAIRQEEIRTRDLGAQVELDVRLALDSLHSADSQVQTSRQGLTLAQSELEQAQRRYQAGVANSLEVTDAQTRLDRARDNQVDALY